MTKCQSQFSDFYNNILHGRIEHLLIRPLGRLPKKPILLYHSFWYQAASWGIPQSVVAETMVSSKLVFGSLLPAPDQVGGKLRRHKLRHSGTVDG